MPPQKHRHTAQIGHWLGWMLVFTAFVLNLSAPGRAASHRGARETCTLRTDAGLPGICAVDDAADTCPGTPDDGTEADEDEGSPVVAALHVARPVAEIVSLIVPRGPTPALRPSAADIALPPPRPAV